MSFDVVMPLFNKAAYVGAAIESVLRQGFPHWRLFVVDDGSTDRSAEIVRSFSDPRIVVYDQGNAGVSAARNAGIAAGHADWIAFLDADDLWRSDHLHELDRVRREFPEAWLVGCGFEPTAAPDGSAVEAGKGGAVRSARYFHEASRGRALFYTSSAAVRRWAVDQVGGFGPFTGGEDLELWARLALGGPVAVSSRKTVVYRTGIGGLSVSGGASEDGSGRAVRLEDVSATIPTLVQALPTIADRSLRTDVEDYIDSRVDLALTAAVRGCRIDEARQLRRLYYRGPRGRARWLAAFVRLPAALARSIIRSMLAVRT